MTSAFRSCKLIAAAVVTYELLSADITTDNLQQAAHELVTFASFSFITGTLSRESSARCDASC